MSSFDLVNQFPSGHVICRVDLADYSVTANTDIFPSGIIPQTKGQAFMVVHVAFQHAGRLKTIRTRATSATTTTAILNEDQDLVANGAYIYSVVVRHNQSLNFQYSQNTTASEFMVFESEMR